MSHFKPGSIVGTDEPLDDRFHDWIGCEFRRNRERRRWVMTSTDRTGDGTWMVRLRRVTKEGTDGELLKLTAREFVTDIEAGRFTEV